MDKEFNKIFANTMGHEGGIDRTNPNRISNYGVEQQTYDKWNKEHNKPMKSVEEISYGEARDIGYNYYYKPAKIDKFEDEGMRNLLFDYEYNSGSKKSIKTLQNILGVKADGIVGKNTMKAYNDFKDKYTDKTLKESYLTEREANYADIAVNNPEKMKYLNGWINRVNKQRAKYLP